MTTWAEAAALNIAIATAFADLSSELNAWSNGTVNGGPNNDGKYPFTQADGTQLFFKCPANLQAMASSDNVIYPEEIDPLAGSSSTHDDGPAIQAMFNAQFVAPYPRPALQANKRYRSGQKILIDPARNSLDGNNATIGFDLKTFSDINALPNLFSDPGFDTGTPWIADPEDTMGSGSVFNGQWTVTQPVGAKPNYVFRKQRIMGVKAGDTIVIKITIPYINPITYGVNTYHSVDFSLRGANSTTGAINGTDVGSNQSHPSDNSSSYTPNKVWTWTVTCSVDNPWIRINSNAEFSIDFIEAKIQPDNTCFLVRGTKAGPLRGSNIREFRNFKVTGRAGQGQFVDAFVFDTPKPALSSDDIGQYSRVNFYQVDISDNVNRGLVFGAQAYLHDFFACRVVCPYPVVGLGGYNTGENIAFFGGNMGGGKIAVLNTPGMAFRFHSVSFDFITQWFVGSNIVATNCWFETNSQGGTDDSGNQIPTVDVPLIDCTAGTAGITIRNSFFQQDGDSDTKLLTPFRVAKGGVLDIEANAMFKFPSRGDAMCTGEGRFFLRQLGGGTVRAVEAINKRDDEHNVVGSDGHFEAATINVPAFLLASGSQVNADRYTLIEPQTGSFTGSVAIGSTLVYGLTASPNSGYVGRQITSSWADPGTVVANYQTASAGFTGNTTLGSAVITGVSPGPTSSTTAHRYITGAGIPRGAKIIAYNATTGTITMDTYADATATGVAISCPDVIMLSQPANATVAATAIAYQVITGDSAIMRLTKAYTPFDGTQCLEIYKNLPSASPVQVEIAVPCQPGRGYGAEVRWAVPPNSAFSSTQKGTVYINPYLRRIIGADGASPRFASNNIFLTDLPKTDIPLATGTDGWVDRAPFDNETGMWRKIQFSLNAPGSGNHNGFTPDWATHLVFQFSMVNMPRGSSILIDGLIGNNQ